MKKLISLFSLTGFLFAQLFSFISNCTTPNFGAFFSLDLKDDYVETPYDFDAPLGNTACLLKDKQAVTVAYFGGSITEGAGASRDSCCWRRQISCWLKLRYPQSKITEVDASIGGTGSDLGVFRTGQDVLSAEPDLVFIEFAVNDGGKSYEEERLYIESIIRLVYEKYPYADVVLVFTDTSGTTQAWRDGTLTTVNAQLNLARHYGIPAIDIGGTLIKYMDGEGLTWDDVSGDGVHPNDFGYNIYTAKLREKLALYLVTPETGRREKTLPEPTGAVFANAEMLDARTVQLSEGWTEGDALPWGGYASSVVTTTPGATLTAEFDGTAAGLIIAMTSDSGRFSWSVDGGEPQTVSTWDIFCLGVNRTNYKILTTELENGHHTLTITVLDTHDEQSTGTRITVGAVLYGTAQ